MGIFKKMFSNNSVPAKDPIFDTIFSYLSANDDFDIDSNGDVWTVSSDVFSLVTKLANDIADKPLLSNTAYKDSLFSGNVNDHMSYRTWITSTLINLLLWGDSFTLIQTDKNNMVSSLELLPTPKVTVLKSSNGLSYQYNDDTTYDEKDVLHFKMNSLDGLVGTSNLKSLRKVLKLSRASNKALQKYYDNLSFSRFILSVDDKLSNEDKMRLKEAFKNNIGLNSDGSSIVTDNSVSISPIKDSSINGDILKATKQNDYFASKICNAYHVPGYVLGIQNPHASADSEYSEYRLSLKPYMNIITDELSSKLSSDFEFQDNIKPQNCTDISNLTHYGAITPAQAQQLLGLK